MAVIVLIEYAVRQTSATLAAAAATGPTLWYLTRMAAVSAYIVLTISALLGMLRGVARGAGEHLSWITDELHQVLATVFGGLTLLHLVTLYFHTFIPFTLLNFLVPGNQPYRPFAVDMGVLGFYGLVLVLVSSWLRRWIPYRIWRRVHYMSFVIFVLVTVHGLAAGSDAGEPWMRAVYVGSSAAVGFLVVMRLLTLPRPKPAITKAPPPERELTFVPAPRKPHSSWEQ